jgi:hypothetical protein
VSDPIEAMLASAEAIDREKAEEVKRLRAALVEAEASLSLLADRAYGKKDGEIERKRVLKLVRAALEAKP